MDYPASKQVRMMLNNPSLKQGTINNAAQWYGWPKNQPPPLLVALRIRQATEERLARGGES